MTLSAIVVLLVVTIVLLPRPASAQTPATTPVADVSSQVARIWTYDSGSGSWKLYDPAVPGALSTLRHLEYGKTYYVLAKEGATLQASALAIPVSQGWNHIHWGRSSPATAVGSTPSPSSAPAPTQTTVSPPSISGKYSSSDVYVSGYYRKNGTYVRGHYRSKADGNPYNNYSYPGNYNPYTGKIAKGSPVSYLRRYSRK